MLAEKARVVALEPDAIWVETLSKSSCGSCAEKQHCGTGLLGRYLQGSSFLRIHVGERMENRYAVGDELELGLDESVVVRGSMTLYLLPLAGLLVGAGAGAGLGSEALSILLGGAGLVLAGLGLRWHAWKNRLNPAYNPVILEESVILSRQQHA